MSDRGSGQSGEQGKARRGTRAGARGRGATQACDTDLAADDGKDLKAGPGASYHDFSRSTGEAAYHAFLLGVLVNLGPEYDVRSNRESGYGRYDLMLLPKQPGRSGVVLELKVLDDEEGEPRAETALQEALGQLERKDYETELRERGASPIQAMAVVFFGKRVWVRKAGV